MKSVGKIRDFYSFGIYGRDFSLDSEPESNTPTTPGPETTTPDSAGIVKTSVLLIAIMMIAKIWLQRV